MELQARVLSFIFRLSDWKEVVAQGAGRPVAPWVLECFAHWSTQVSYVNWEYGSRNAEQWAAPAFLFHNHNVDWLQFTIQTDDAQAWKLPILRAAAAAGKFTWKHWRRLSLFAREWMLPLLEENADKVDFEEFMHFGVHGSEIYSKEECPKSWWCHTCGKIGDVFVYDTPKEIKLQPWKAAFVLRNADKLDWNKVCRHAHSSFKRVFEERFDKIVWSKFLKVRALWKIDLLMTKDANDKWLFDWAGADKQTWKYISRDACYGMPIEEHFDCLDMHEFSNNAWGGPVRKNINVDGRWWRWSVIENNKHRVAWSEFCEKETRERFRTVGRTLELVTTSIDGP